MSALYRIHRPQDFHHVVGQQHVVRTLRNAVDAGNVAHAYLFAGPRGTGKTSMAKILAKALNCEQGPTTTPCLRCEACRSIHDATSIDVIELDAASHRGIDDIREIRDRVALRPARGRMKVYIVDEAHMLTKEASNAVLKTLEEPPEHVVFVLCTTELQAMLPTIRSRCQRFTFFRPSLAEIGQVLSRIAAAEGIEADDAALTLIARSAGGSFRDAVSTLDQLATACDRRIGTADVQELLGSADQEVLFRAFELVAERDAGGCLRLIDELVDGGADLGSLIGDLLAHLRRLFLVQQLGELPADAAVTEDERTRLEQQAGRVEPAAVTRLVDMLRAVLEEVKQGADARLPLEISFVKACRPQLDVTVEALEQRLERLEAALAGDRPAAPANGSRTAAAGPPPAEPGPAAAPDLDRLRERWPEGIVAEVARQSAPLGALVKLATPVAWEDGEVVLAFPHYQRFAKATAESTQNVEILCSTLTRALGTPVRVRLSVEEAPVEEEGAPAEAGLSEEELYSRIKETFDAREVEEA